MGRILIAAIAGSVVLYVWGALAWMVLPLHDASLRDLYGLEGELEAIAQQVERPGVYAFPPRPSEFGDSEVYRAYAEVHEQGPVGLVVIEPDGAELMGPATFAAGYGLNLVTAGLVSMLVAVTAVRRYLARVGFVVLIGAVVVVSADGLAWNWLGYPGDWTGAMALDRLAGFLLLGLVVGAIVRPGGPGEPAGAEGAVGGQPGAIA